jgi:signal peptide peptidase SppA
VQQTLKPGDHGRKKRLSTRFRALLAKLPIERFRHPPPVVAVVPLVGIIGRIGPWRRGLTVAGLAATLERAFTLEGVKAVALSVNSPGGSPVQSALIGRRIRALAAEQGVPVFGFAEDVAASGGYWLLAAADELYADESSIVGSIGVLSAGFGFAEILKRFGIERRVYASGEHKDALDPFQPEKLEEVEHLRSLQEDIHEAFRRHVRERRAGRLKGEEKELFSGRFWTGVKARELGLIDDLGDVRTVMRARFGENVRLVVVSDGRPWWRRRLGGLAARAMGKGPPLADELLASLEERLMWNRFGL